MRRQKAHCQSPSLYLVRFDAICLFESEQSWRRGVSEDDNTQEQMDRIRAQRDINAMADIRRGNRLKYLQ